MTNPQIQEEANRLVDALLDECPNCGCDKPLATIAAPCTCNKRRFARGAGHTPPVDELNDLDQSLPHVRKG